MNVFGKIIKLVGPFRPCVWLGVRGSEKFPLPGKIEKYSEKEWFVLYFQPGMTSSSVSIKEHNLLKPASQITSSRVFCSSQSTQVIIPSCSIPQAVFGNSSLSNRFFFGGGRSFPSDYEPHKFRDHILFLTL